MRKLLSMVLCLSMIISIFACVSVSANTETETETKTFELVAQGGSGLSYKLCEAEVYATNNSLYTYYKFKIPKGATLTSADLTIHLADNKERTDYSVTPYVVTDATFWQDNSTTFTAPDTAPTMSSMGSVSLNGIMAGSSSIKELVISENEVLKNSINELAAEGKDYVVIAIKSSGKNTNYICFVNYFKEAPAGIAATLTATGIFDEVVTDFSDAVVGFNKETGAYTVTTAATSGTAMLIVASFDTTGMVDVRVTTINANTAVNGTISGNMEILEAGTSVKAFLLHPTTIAPFKGVTDL